MKDNKNESTNISINILMTLIIMISMYILYNEYVYEKEKGCEFILNPEDFENNINKYNNSVLYNRYSNLSDPDKIFINDYINYIRLKHKIGKPKFNKKIKNIKSQVFYASIASLLFASSFNGFFSAIRQKSIQYFITSGI